MTLTKYMNIPDYELITNVYLQDYGLGNDLAIELALRLENLLDTVKALLLGDPDAEQRLQEIINAANSRG